MLENVTTDPTKPIKFDVFVNDEDDKPTELDRAEYAGSFAQLPHKVKTAKSTSSLRFNLKKLYEEPLVEMPFLSPFLSPLPSGCPLCCFVVKIGSFFVFWICFQV